MHEISKEKNPDHLADSCKRFSINQMAAGLSIYKFAKFNILYCSRILSLYSEGL